MDLVEIVQYVTKWQKLCNWQVKCVNYKCHITELFWYFLEAVLAVCLTDEKKKHQIHVIFQNYNQPAKIDPNKQGLKTACTSLVCNGVEYISLHILL